ncbi:MAG: DNA alkylation repair protein [Nitrospirae bacterium]|nr:DNA alkylation repair protein [Nitrospirota bacterium]
MDAPAAARRKPARSRDRVPADVLAGLSDGTLEALNLVEWLVVDQARLAEAVLPALGQGAVARELAARARALAGEGVMARLAAVGNGLFELLADHPRRGSLLAALAGHPSDTVRQWAAYATLANPALDLKGRLEACLPFATDRNMGVREIAWMVFRPHLAVELLAGLGLLAGCGAHADANVRRFASEASRPCGVWCAHIPALKADPEPGRAVLEPLRADSSRYVRTSVANWLNDASKTRPEWVEALCLEWLDGSAAPETRWIVNHATRTLRKRGTLSGRVAARLAE